MKRLLTLPAVVVTSLVALPAGAKPADAFGVFEAEGDGCAWHRLELPSGVRKKLASFPGTKCDGVSVAFGPKGGSALVWFDPELRTGTFASKGYPAAAHPAPSDEKGGDSSLWHVELGGARAFTVTKLPAPKVQGKLRKTCVADDGKLVAMSLEEVGDEKSVERSGKKIEFKSGLEGIPAVAYGYTLMPGQTTWTEIEVVESSTGAGLAPGVGILAASGACVLTGDLIASPASELTLDQAAPLTRGVGKGLTALTPVAGEDGDNGGFWRAAQLASEPTLDIFVWQILGDYGHDTGLIAARRGENPEKMPGIDYTAGDLTLIETSGQYVLVATAGARGKVRVIDVPAGRVVYKSDAPRGAGFLPTPPLEPMCAAAEAPLDFGEYTPHVPADFKAKIATLRGSVLAVCRSQNAPPLATVFGHAEDVTAAFRDGAFVKTEAAAKKAKKALAAGWAKAAFDTLPKVAPLVKCEPLDDGFVCFPSYDELVERAMRAGIDEDKAFAGFWQAGRADTLAPKGAENGCLRLKSVPWVERLQTAAAATKRFKAPSYAKTASENTTWLIAPFASVTTAVCTCDKDDPAVPTLEAIATYVKTEAAYKQVEGIVPAVLEAVKAKKVKVAPFDDAACKPKA